MKLYYGGFGDYMVFAVAEDMQDAIGKIGEKITAPFLPITAEEISEIDGFTIQAFKSGSCVDTALKIEAPSPEEPPEKCEETALRHCKKCDFTCETQGELLKHYREMHPKGD